MSNVVSTTPKSNRNLFEVVTVNLNSLEKLIAFTGTKKRCKRFVRGCDESTAFTIRPVDGIHEVILTDPDSQEVSTQFQGTLKQCHTWIKDSCAQAEGDARILTIRRTPKGHFADKEHAKRALGRHLETLVQWLSRNGVSIESPEDLGAIARSLIAVVVQCPTVAGVAPLELFDRGIDATHVSDSMLAAVGYDEQTEKWRERENVGPSVADHVCVNFGRASTL